MEVILENGSKLAYDRQGTGPALLLLHGFPLDRSIWKPLAASLDRDYDIIMPDLRGFGQSELPEGEYTIDQMATDLVDLLDQLHIQKTYIAGHSMGGYVALAFAKLTPGRVLGMSLIGSQAVADTAERKASRYATAQKVVQDGCEAVVGMSENLSADRKFVPGLREIILRQQPAGLAGALKAMASRSDATALMAGFKFPITLVHGLADVLIPAARAQEIKSLHPQIVLVELPGVGHSPMLEAPDQTALALLNFKQLF